MISSYKFNGYDEISKKSFNPYTSSFHGINSLINYSKIDYNLQKNETHPQQYPFGYPLPKPPKIT
jgi:hypothetical protein